jgi:hypothetical protein
MGVHQSSAILGTQYLRPHLFENERRKLHGQTIGMQIQYFGYWACFDSIVSLKR